MKKNIVTICTFFILFSIVSFAQSFDKSDIFEKNIILKIKPSQKSICFSDKVQSNELNNFLKTIKVIEIKKKFPQIQSPKTEKNKNGEKLVDISTIYHINYAENIPIEKIIQKLNSFDIVEYAQPEYKDYLLYTPNDPLIGNQYYLSKIKAYEAWDIEKGDTNVVIGIVDTGIDFTHEDLAGNIAYNYNDPIDGFDNDNDGFVDNFRGWDVAKNDNNPMTEAGAHHGTQVSGYAGATVDNSLGISGTGFKCKILPVKISNSFGMLENSYEGIVYAAEHGCQIINCSWGSCFGHPYGQDIINYVTFNKNALIISSAGNSNCGSEHVMYPAAFENVISVAASNVNDIKWVNTTTGGSTYGYKIDVTAPGDAVHTTDDGNKYMNGWGTSYASPIVAGIAGIVKSHFPNLTALQIGEKIRVTCDSIDYLAGNTDYVGKLGTGRTNMLRAITEANTPAVRFSNIKMQIKSQNYSIGDTIYISGLYKNYLDDVQNLTTTLTAISPNIEIINGQNVLGNISILDTVSNNQNPFSFVIKSNAFFDVPVIFKILYNGVGYSDFQYFDVLVNSTLLNIYPNKISTTISANGRIGFNTMSPLTGIGLIYKDLIPLYDCGLIVANSNTNVSSSVANFLDFVSTSKAVAVENEKVDSMYKATFNVNLNDDFRNIEITQNTLAWNDSLRDNFIIMEYFLKNTGNSVVDNLYVSLYTDWDLGELNMNRTDFNETFKMGYTYNLNSDSLYAGVSVLTNNTVNHYAIDNVEGGNDGTDVSDSFTKNEQFFTITNNRNIAGVDVGALNDNLGDVIELTSVGPMSIQPSDSTRVAFAMIVSDNLYDLKNSAYESKLAYSNLYSSTFVENIRFKRTIEIFPNPTKSQLNIKMQGISTLKYTIYNVKGQSVFESNNMNVAKSNCLFKTDVSKFEKGFYFVKFDTEFGQIFKKFVVN